MTGKYLKYLVLMLLVTITGCSPIESQQDPGKWRITLDKNDKGPYGAYLAYESLKYYFPDAKVELLSRSFRYTSMSDDMKYNYSARSLLILEGMSFHLSAIEWKELKQFIKNGNEVILFCSTLDDKIQDELNCYKISGGEDQNVYYGSIVDFDYKDVLALNSDTNKKYGYEGRSLDGHFVPKTNSGIIDSAQQNYQSDTDEDQTMVPDTLGYAYHTPDFVRYSIGEGHLTLHAAPLVLSNYFLLQPGNEHYLTGIWQTLPQNINRVYWNGYYYRSIDLTSFGILWRYPAARWALLLGIVLLLLYILFEGKRKQRIIPVIPPLKNDSVSFVETVGRLYYNKGNHANLAEKMVQQFLEWVRSHYFLNTNLLNENFIQQLTIKSGQPEATVRSLLEMIAEIKMGYTKTDDAYLYQLYNTIQHFYKNHNK
jgi:hypothetical protein